MKSLKRVEGINVVPLIDVMLVLLAIILTISSFIALGKIEMTLPNGSTTTKLENKTYNISISASNKFYVNDKEFAKDKLKDKLKEITKKDSVSISADKKHPMKTLFLLLIF